MAAADVERYAVLIGNDTGQAHEPALQYAVRDAERVYNVLHDLGGFRPANMIMLRNESAETVRETLLSVNERVRSTSAKPGTQAMLLLYYSGHADARNLHLGSSELSVRELASIARGSAADFRLVILDACRSGVLTREKGGVIVPPFPLEHADTLPGTGLAFLTASSEDENAQESDQLKGSFFTHALVSGLLGAADRNHDGKVVLAEAYDHAYQSTLRGTSRTFAGVQHPTFRFDFSGHGQLVLTQLEPNSSTRSQLLFPDGLDFLVLRDGSSGQVVAEIEATSRRKFLSLRAGAYYLRARGPAVLYEGEITAAAGTSTVVDLRTLERVEFARLVRKGGSGVTFAHSLALGGNIRTSLKTAVSPCLGAALAYGLETHQLGFRLTVSACEARTDTGLLATRTRSYAMELRLHRGWDWRILALDIGVEAGGSLSRQVYRGPSAGGPRLGFAPFLGVGAGLNFNPFLPWFIRLDGAAEAHLLRTQDRAGESVATSIGIAGRSRLSLGRYF